MALRTGMGVASDDDLVTALKAAAASAKEGCANPRAVLVFITHSYPQEELAAAARTAMQLFPDAQTAGGQVNGITYDDVRYDAVFANRRAVAVVALGGEGVDIAVAMKADPKDDPKEAGRGLARDVLERLDGPAVGGVFLGMGLATLPPIDQTVLDGIREVDPRLRMSGTGLCGGMQMDGSYEPGVAFFGETLALGGTILLAFSGGVKLGFSTANGMEPVGSGAFITKVEGMEIVELNGKPAKDVVLDLLAGTEDAELRGMFEKNPQVMGVERGVTLAAPDPEGDFFWCHFPAVFTPRGGVIDAFGPAKGMGLAVTKIDPDSCMNAVSSAAGMLKEDAGGEEFEALLVFSCSLRGFTLGPGVAREDAELRKHVRAKHQLGIVANGEIGCHRQGRPFFTGWVLSLLGAVAE